MDYDALLKHSFDMCCETRECAPESRLEWLGDDIFNFTTYDSSLSVFFADKAIPVCEAITNRKTFEYIDSSQENYLWFITMCNMPFFSDNINWGTSIRGAWWDDPARLKFGYNLWFDNKQGEDVITFSRVEWEKFIRAIINFAKGE